MKAKEVTLVGILTGLAICLNVAEVVFLPPIIPGAKLGLANIVTVVGIYFLSRRVVLGVAFLRTVIASILLGSFLSASFYLSFAGALISAAIIIVTYSINNKVSPVFLSIVGAISHNIAQLTVAYFLVGYGFVYYLPYLIIFAVPTGYLTGVIATRVLKAGVGTAVQVA